MESHDGRAPRSQRLKGRQSTSTSLRSRSSGGLSGVRRCRENHGTGPIGIILYFHQQKNFIPFAQATTRELTLAGKYANSGNTTNPSLLAGDKMLMLIPTLDGRVAVAGEYVPSSSPNLAAFPCEVVVASFVARYRNQAKRTMTTTTRPAAPDTSPAIAPMGTDSDCACALDR